MVIKVLCASIIEVQTSKFKMTMISSTKVALGPFDIINPLIKMWKIITNVTILFCNAMEYVKLVKIAMIQMLSSMEALQGIFILTTNFSNYFSIINAT